MRYCGFKYLWVHSDRIRPVKPIGDFECITLVLLRLEVREIDAGSPPLYLADLLHDEWFLSYGGGGGTLNLVMST